MKFVVKRTPLRTATTALLLAAALSAPVSLAQRGHYQLHDAVLDAVNFDPRIEAAQADLAAAEKEIEIARGGYHPSVSAQAGAGKLDGDTEYQINVRQVVYDWGRVSSQVDSSRAESQLSSEQLKLARSTVAFDAANSYLSYTRNRQITAVYKDYLAALNRLIEVARERADRQFSSGVEVDRATLEKLRALQAQARHHGERESARREFLELTGKDPEHLTLLPPPELAVLDYYDNPAELEAAIALAPRVSAELAEVGKARAELALSKAQLLPQLNLEADWVRREFNQDIDSDVIVALRLRTDTYFGLSNLKQPQAARSRVQARDHQLRATRRELRRSLQQLGALEPALQARIKTLDKQLQGSQNVRTTYQQQFFAGLRDFDDLLAVTRDHFEAKRQQVELQTELLRLQYQVAADLGVLNHMLASKTEPDYKRNTSSTGPNYAD